jgi:hypothetical protein
MKTKLLISILFALGNFFAVGQSVPNTTTFTLQTVCDAINPSTEDLVDCFSDAIPGYFNPAYSGSKNSLLNFQDYGPHNEGCVTLPSATELTYPARAQTSINVRTSAISDCAIVSRIIYYSTAHIATESDTPFAQANTTGQITTTVTGLSPNTGYYFSVYVYNAYGLDYMQQGFKYSTLP